MDYVKLDAKAPEFEWHFYTGTPDQEPSKWKFSVIRVTAPDIETAIKEYFKKKDLQWQINNPKKKRKPTNPDTMTYFVLRRIDQHVREFDHPIALLGLKLVSRYIQKQFSWQQVHTFDAPILELY